MTSSPGALPPPYDAIVRRGDQGIGPVRLPLKEQQRFIEDFNRLYRHMGISVAEIESQRREDADLAGQRQVEPISS